MADANLARQLTEQVSRLRQRQTAPLILELDLTDGIAEGPVTDPLSAIMTRRKLRPSNHSAALSTFRVLPGLCSMSSYGV